MRAIDVHVHPMNQAYVQASLASMPAAQRMFKGKFEARPDSQIAGFPPRRLPGHPNRLGR